MHFKLLRLYLPVINPNWSSSSWRIILLYRLNKSSKKTYHCLTPLFLCIYWTYPLSWCRVFVPSRGYKLLKCLYHINQAFVVFEVVLCVISYQVPLCNLWNIGIDIYVFVLLILIIRVAFYAPVSWTKPNCYYPIPSLILLQTLFIKILMINFVMYLITMIVQQSSYSFPSGFFGIVMHIDLLMSSSISLWSYISFTISIALPIPKSSKI